MNPKSAPIDLKKLMTAGDVSEADRIWSVEFSVKISTSILEDMAASSPEIQHALNNQSNICPDCGDIHSLEDLRTFHDEMTVLAGEDGQVAVDRVRDHVLSSDCTDFKLQGLSLLASAELT